VEPRLVLGLIARQVSSTGLPVPVPRRVIYSWAEGLGIPSRDPRGVYLYTGGLYQLAPYIRRVVEMLSLLEGSRLGSLALKLAGAAPVNRLPVHLLLRPDKGEVRYSRRVLRAVASLLKKAGVGYGYLYDLDHYSGTILYELGLEEEFALHASRVVESWRGLGVEKLVTVDPHTTHIARNVYPKFVDGYDIEVVNYLEVLEGRLGEARVRLQGEYVIHDPCLYARFEGIIDQPRGMLGKGLRLKEPPRTRRMTYCCGGPIEALFPSLAKKIAVTRLEELRRVSDKVVTLCPICRVNLASVSKGGESIDDAAVLLERIYLGG